MKASVDSPVFPDKLGIHVLSASLGESIIVTMPDGHWFVVDAFFGYSRDGGSPKNSYLDSDASLPLHDVIGFLEAFRLDPVKCRFALLTHLHEDHYKGFPSLVRYLRLKNPRLQVVRHSVYMHNACRLEIQQLLKNRDDRAPAVDQTGARAREVVEMLGAGCQDVAQWNPIFPEPLAGCQVQVVMPPREMARDWTVQGLLASLHPDTRRLVDLSVEHQDTLLNNMSVALWITFGKASVLLTGDCEKHAWSTLALEPSSGLTGQEPSNPLSTVRFLKAPHHGSSRAWHGSLESLYRQSESTIATNHCRGRYNLPDINGVEKILEQGAQIAVPDTSLLDDEIRERFEKEGGIRRIPLLFGRVGSRKEAKAKEKRFGRPVQPELMPEICWVSRSFDRDGSATEGWFGGNRAALLGRS